MGIVLRNTTTRLGAPSSIGTLSVTTAETLYTIGSGAVAVDFYNNSSVVPIFYGSSGLRVNSAGAIPTSGTKTFDTVAGAWSAYFGIQSAGVTVGLSFTEFSGQ